jgi:recombination protein RecA
MNQKEKTRALELALAHISKTFGESAAIQLGNEKPRPPRAVFSTGALAVDLMLNGGFPREMITELYGPEGGGKSTLAMTATGIAQREGEQGAYIDAEHGFDPTYARQLGVDVDNLVISQPNYAEEALQIVETLIDSSAVKIIVVDSVAALCPKAEFDGEIGDANVAPLPRLMAQALRKLTVKVRKQNVALIFINQIRELINVFGFGEKTTTPGGRALKHQSSLRLQVKRIAALKVSEKVVGSRVQAKALKSRVCVPYQEAEFDLIYGVGIDKEADLLDVATALTIVEKQGSNYSFGSVRLGNGRLNACKLLRNEIQLADAVRKLVLEQAAANRNAKLEEKVDQ